MPYKNTYKVLSDQLGDLVLIKSPFQETSRTGIAFRSVLLALTESKFVIVSRQKVKDKPSLYYNKLESQHDLKNTKIVIFKKSHKQALKVSYTNNIRYFELAQCKKRKIFWELWCNHIKEINRGLMVWPFRKTKFLVECKYNVPLNSKEDNFEYECKNGGVDKIDSNEEKNGDNQDFFDENFQFPQRRTRAWTDKYLYLGSKRELEDASRPIPIPGLGKPEEIRLLYLKPQYFGCYEQTEHWVQCDDSFINTPYDSNLYDSNVYTYTGEPTSNVTYTSIMTTVSIISYVEVLLLPLLIL